MIVENDRDEANSDLANPRYRRIIHLTVTDHEADAAGERLGEVVGDGMEFIVFHTPILVRFLKAAIRQCRERPSVR